MNLKPARAALSVASIYGFFLIFAQFSFVELLRAHGIGLTDEKIVLGLMAAAGMGAGFGIARLGVSAKAVRAALAVAAVSAALATQAAHLYTFIGISLLVGAALGVATVGLSALLPGWCSVTWIGLGTGLGYAFCNVPAVFMQSPAGQAWIAAGLALLGFIALPSGRDWQIRTPQPATFPLWAVLTLFTALVWLDSAAFFIIQHAGDLKSATWGETLLWRNAAVHFAIACAAGIWLKRGGAHGLPATAWLILAMAALMVNAASSRGIAGWLYPAGVSLYSTALVAWPGWFSGSANAAQAGKRAAWLFAIAGWFGSANGIGMAQTLQQVPPLFVLLSGAVIAGVMLLSMPQHWRAAAAVGVVLFAGWCGQRTQGRSAAVTTQAVIDRGQQVYLSEGCIHCHSQYVRPGSPDEALWGSARRVEDVLQGKPVLIGNRRQGPDLSFVGARRSEAWIKAHFIDPRALMPDSVMPAYAHLFQDHRGDDLVTYLKESGLSAMADVMKKANTWQPATTARSSDGPALYAKYCSMCHGPEGDGRGSLASTFTRPVPSLVSGPFAWTIAGENQELRTARIIKFGIPGTDMAGHEVMRDDQVNALVAEVLRLRKK